MLDNIAVFVMVILKIISTCGSGISIESKEQIISQHIYFTLLLALQDQKVKASLPSFAL